MTTAKERKGLYEQCTTEGVQKRVICVGGGAVSGRVFPESGVSRTGLEALYQYPGAPRGAPLGTLWTHGHRGKDPSTSIVSMALLKLHFNM